MLISLSQALKDAKKHGYAVGAFNINNIETARAVLEGAHALSSPIILSTSEGALQYAGMDVLGACIHALAKQYDIPIVYHLDHGKDINIVKKAIRSGWYTSIMFDGSSLPFEENIKYTRALRRLAHWHGISIEAELGVLSGIEDHVQVESKNAHFTDPDQARTFVMRTKCDALAIAIGTSHGAYKFKTASHLDFQRLEEIAHHISTPLVLHGASGVPEHIKQLCIANGCAIENTKGVSDDHIRQAISLGITKINIDTDLRIAFDAGLRHYLNEHPDIIDPRKILGSATELMQKVVMEKITLFGSAHRA